MAFGFIVDVIILFTVFILKYHLAFLSPFFSLITQFFFSSFPFLFEFVSKGVFSFGECYSLCHKFLFFLCFSYFSIIIFLIFSFALTLFNIWWGYPKLKMKHNLKNTTITLNMVWECLGRGLYWCGDIYKQRDIGSNWVNKG